jgi:imidazolonepropionase-like amidohydrolase
MRRQNVAVIPTLMLFSRGRFVFDVLDEVRDYARSGGQILFGTDVGYLTAYDPTDEYVLMASAGLGWREILASLTTSPAARFGEAGRRGKVSPGMDGDLVVLDTDPVRDVRAFANVRHTIRAGVVVYSKAPG